ncbi:MAG: FliM/FliN family flagellar motor switch protein [SAR324 cluster bacterium]|nr:FliM/FliN family flagellar motor switch protein [SAR324 cluster bacterium]MBL7034899.1 FliM/FliN family flagellar motor switch protein [SAR324 cluster bacterium]
MLHQTDKSVTPYDLAESSLSTGRFHLMDVVFRRWASLLKETLYVSMGRMIEVTTTNVEQLRFENFIDTVSEQPIYIFDTLNQSKGLFLVDNTFFFKFVLNTLAVKQPEQTPLVQLMKEYQNNLLALVRPIIDDFHKSWFKIAEVELKLNRVTIYPRRAQVMLPFEHCYVGRVQLKVDNIQSEIKLCLPFSGLDPLLNPLEKKRVIAPESMEYYFPQLKQHFVDLLQKADYQVVAELGKADLSAVKGKLEKGQVLPLQNEDGLVTIRINGSPALQGSTGESDGNYSVQVIRGIDDKKPSAIQQKKEFKKVSWPAQ